MKKVLSLLLSVCMLCTVLCGVNVVSFAAGDAPKNAFGDFLYETKTENGETYQVVYAYTGKDAKIIVPAKIKGVAVKQVGEEYNEENQTKKDFFNKDEAVKNITSITFEEGIETVGFNGSFANLPSLSEVKFPKSVKTIGSDEFSGCTALKEVSFANGLKAIGAGAFYGCTALKDITLPDGVRIGYKAFWNTAAYEDKANVKNGGLYLSDYLIKINADVKGVYAIPAGTKGVADVAFAYSKEITGIKVPASVTVFPENPYVNLPTWEKGISRNAFNKIKGVYVDAKNKVYSSRRGVLFNKKQTKLFWYPAAKTAATLKMPNTVKAIGDFAFYNNKNLKKVTFGSKVRTLGENAFENCRNLKSVKMNKGLKTIGNYAFYNCKNLKVYAIPKTVKKIGFWAIGACKSYQTKKYGTVYRYRKITIKGAKNSAAYKYYRTLKKSGSKYYQWKFVKA